MLTCFLSGKSTRAALPLCCSSSVICIYCNFMACAGRGGKPSLPQGWKHLITLLDKKDPVKPFNVLDILLGERKRLPLICELGCFLHSNSTHLCFYFICLCDECPCLTWYLSKGRRWKWFLPSICSCESWWCCVGGVLAVLSIALSVKRHRRQSPQQQQHPGEKCCLRPSQSSGLPRGSLPTLGTVFCALHTQSHKILVVFIKTSFFLLCCLALILFSL